MLWLVALVCAVLCGMGLGGGTFLVLYLTLISGIDQKLAQGLGLLFILPAGIASTIVSLENRLLDTRLAAILLVGGVIGIIIGSGMVTQLDTNIIRKIFSIFIIVVGAYQLIFAIKAMRKNE